MSRACAVLSGRRCPGFIDTHLHLTIDAADLALQTLQSSAAKALKGLSLAREYMNYGFTTTLISAPPCAVGKLQHLDAMNAGGAVAHRRSARRHTRCEFTVFPPDLIGDWVLRCRLSPSS